MDGKHVQATIVSVALEETILGLRRHGNMAYVREALKDVEVP
jgi:hypothetical protein